MNIRYKVQMIYPDGHAETVDDVFNTMDDAITFGNSLLSQIGGTESYKNPFSNKKAKSYFFVIQETDLESKMVYDSNYPKRR